MKMEDVSRYIIGFNGFDEFGKHLTAIYRTAN